MAGVAELAEGLDAFTAVSPIFLSDDDLLASVDAVMVAASRLAAVQACLVREVDGRGLARSHGASSVLAWVKGRYLLSRSSAARLVRLAADLDGRSAPVVGAALAVGGVNPDQAEAICQALRELPDDLDPATRVKAEEHLVEFAATHDPVTLIQLGRRILDAIDPELSEAREAELLRKQEERAYAARAFTLSRDDLTGRTRLTGILDTESAAIVRAALDPLCAPGRSRLFGGTGPGGTAGPAADHANGSPLPTGTAGPEADDDPTRPDVVDDRTPAQRRADALVDLCRLALATGDLPDNGGDRPQLALTADYDTLTGQLKAGALNTGERLSPEAVRRIACDCAILPAIMNGTGLILDLGRERRLWTGAARKAILLRDGGCAFPGCDRPPRWTDLHHMAEWQHGGTTDRDNGVALCGHHHRTIHQHHWNVRIAPDGLPEFIPPAYVDRHRRPQRNTYHRRP